MLSERGSSLENGIAGATFMNENSVTGEESPTGDFRDKRNSHTGRKVPSVKFAQIYDELNPAIIRILMVVLSQPNTLQNFVLNPVLV